MNVTRDNVRIKWVTIFDQVDVAIGNEEDAEKCLGYKAGAALPESGHVTLGVRPSSKLVIRVTCHTCHTCHVTLGIRSRQDVDSGKLDLLFPPFPLPSPYLPLPFLRPRGRT